jgi:hypothetical protein
MYFCQLTQRSVSLPLLRKTKTYKNRLLSTLVSLFCLVFISSLALADRLYGDVMPESDQSMLLSQAIEVLNEKADLGSSLSGKFSGKIKQVCQKKGCFMIMHDGDYFARVTFENYGFFVPKDIVDMNAVVFGHLSQIERSVRQINHFLEDAGQAPTANSPRKEYSIIASSVLARP